MTSSPAAMMGRACFWTADHHKRGKEGKVDEKVRRKKERVVPERLWMILVRFLSAC
jgi:hypothetical protein